MNVRGCLIGFLFCWVGLVAQAQNRFEKVQISTQAISDQVYFITGAGGNILLFVTDDGALMIDSQFAPLSSKIKEAISQITEQPLHYLINTHHHGDHTGGNANFNEEHTSIIAHENVLSRLKSEGKSAAFLPEELVDDKMRLSLNDAEIMVVHVDNAHTDGDSFVYIPEFNVLHTGDVFVNGTYPFVDLASGGSISGYIAAQELILSMINPETQLIPGHGKPGGYNQLQFAMEMLVDLKAKVQAAIDKGQSRASIIGDTSLTKQYDQLKYGEGFIGSERMRAILYDGLIEEAKQP